MGIASTPEPPYYAVIFTSVRTPVGRGYNEMSERMLQLAAEQPGFLGAEMSRTETGITVSYWTDRESIDNWKSNAEHRLAQNFGKGRWYSEFKVRITRVEEEYDFVNEAFVNLEDDESDFEMSQEDLEAIADARSQVIPNVENPGKTAFTIENAPLSKKMVRRPPPESFEDEEDEEE